MLEAFYHLSSEPFRLSPDPKFSFRHRTYRKAMAYMRVALHRAEGFIVITGQPGMGKTTLINDLLKELKTNKVTVAKLVSTQLKADDLLHLVAYSFGLDPEGRDKAAVLNRVEQFLKQQRMQGRRSLLIVDEAQDVTEDAMEELRLLTNMQTDRHQLLQIFLVGQQELRDIVSAPSLVQLHQRVIAATHLEPLDSTDTKAYIQHRLQKVGWTGDPAISEKTYAMIYQFSNGIPRQINQICSRLLMHGALEEKHKLGIQDLKTVIEELREELLLPAGIQELADTFIWPEDPVQETYEEIPTVQPLSLAPHQAARAATLKMVATSGMADKENAIRTPAHTERDKPRGQSPAPAPHPADRAATGKTATARGIADRQSVIQTMPNTAANVPGNEPISRRGLPHKKPVYMPEPAAETAGAGARSVHPDAAPFPGGEEDSRRPGHKWRRWKLPGIVALLAGLSVALLYVTDPDMAGHTGNKFISWLNSGIQQVRNSVTLPVPGESPIGETEIQGTGQQSLAADLHAVEEVLARNGLVVKRLDDNALRVDLSSGGLFIFVTDRIQDSAGPTLQKLADVLQKYNRMEVQVVGHTDSTGPAVYNLHLSQLRANAVADYLVNLGLPRSRIQSEGRGDRDTQLEQSSNYSKRRIEIYIRPAEANQIEPDITALRDHGSDLHMQ